MEVMFGLAGLMTLAQLVGCGVIIYTIRKHLLMKLRQKIAFASLKRRSQGHRPRPNHRPRHNHLKDYNKGQIQLLKVFGVIFSISVLTLLPVAGQAIVLMLSFNLCNVVMKACFIFALFRSVIHPIVESYMTNEIRDVISKFFSACGKERRCNNK